MKKLSIRQRPGSENKVMTGANTVLMLGEEILPMVSWFKLECKAAATAKLTVEMYVSLDEISINLEEFQVVARPVVGTYSKQPMIKKVANKNSTP